MILFPDREEVDRVAPGERVSVPPEKRELDHENIPDEEVADLLAEDDEENGDRHPEGDQPAVDKR